MKRQSMLLAMTVLGLGAVVSGCKETSPADDAGAVDVRGDLQGGQEASVPDQGPADVGSDLATPDAVVPDGPGPAPTWVVFGGSTEAPAGAGAIFVDATGNSYVAGYYSGGAITLGTKALPSRNHYAPLVAKLDPSGKVLWVSVLTQGASDAGVKDITMDSAGKLYITGGFEGTVTMGSTSLTSLGNSDGYVVQLDSSGKVQWVTTMGSLEAVVPVGITVDGSGCSYVTGSYDGTALFGSTSLTSLGKKDIFVARLSPVGKFSWAVSGGGTVSDSAGGIALDSSGGLRIAAKLYGAASFGSLKVTPKQTQATIVAKLDGTGKFLWTAQGDGNYLTANAIGVDGAGNSYVTGRFMNQATFGTTVLTQLPTTKYRQYVVKVSPAGAIAWAVAGGGGYSHDIAVDGKGNSVITGVSGGKPTFGSTTLSGIGGEDIVAARLDTQGKWTGAVLAGGAMNEVGKGVALDGAGNAYVTGDVLNPLSSKVPSVNTDTLTFGKQKTTLKGMPQLFVWKVPASSL